MSFIDPFLNQYQSRVASQKNVLFRKVRPRRRVEAAFPFFIAARTSSIANVSGPFPEVQTSSTALNAIGIALTGPTANDWFSVGSDQFFRRHRYWDNQGNEIGSYNTQSQIEIHRGAGFMTARDTLVFDNVGPITTSSTTVGDTTTVTQEYLQDLHTGTDFVVGSATLVTVSNNNTFTVPDNGLYFVQTDQTFNGSYNAQQIYEQVRPDGVVQTFLPYTFNSVRTDINQLNYDLSSTTVIRTVTTDSETTEEVVGNVEIYPGLNLQYRFYDYEFLDEQDNELRESPGDFVQNDVESRDNIDERIEINPRLFQADTRGRGCLYTIDYEESRITDVFSRRRFGTVGSITRVTYPTMRSPTIYGAPVSVNIVSVSGLTQEGSDGGWYSGGTGFPLPALSCPTQQPQIVRSPFSQGVNIDFDTPGAYGDNRSRFFNSEISPGQFVNIFCAWTVTITPSLISTVGGFIGGQLVQLPLGLSSTPESSFWPSVDMRDETDRTRTVTNNDAPQAFLLANGVTYEIDNPDASVIGIDMTGITGSPEWSNLADPAYRGVFTINNPDQTTSFASPRRRVSSVVTTLRDHYTDPSTSTPTSSTQSVVSNYTTEINPLTQLVGKPVFIVNTQTNPWTRFEGVITDATFDVTQTLDFGSTMHIDVSGNGLPATSELTGLTIDITGSTVLNINFDEYMDSNNITVPCLYVARLENLIKRTNNPQTWPALSRTQLIINSPEEIASQTGTNRRLGILTVAGELYTDGGLNLAEIYDIIEDGPGKAVINKRNQQQIAFETIPRTGLTPSGYFNIALAQWGS